MLEILREILIANALIAGAMGAGYLFRRLGLREQVAQWMMWFVLVFGYSTVGTLAVWQINLAPADLIVPALAGLFIAAHTALAGGVGAALGYRGPQRGLFALAGGFGNCAHSMGGLLCYLFFGDEGLGLASVYTLIWYAVLACIAYPVARHFAAGPAARQPLGKLIVSSLWDIRTIGLPMIALATVLSLVNVEMPGWLIRSHIKEVMMYLTAFMAFFAVGLRLHIAQVKPLLKPLVWLGAVRFVGGPLLGLAFVSLVALTPWALSDAARNVFLVESCLPVAVSVVAIANTFGLAPKEASALFVVNTLTYLAVCVPVLAAIFGRG